MQNRNNKFETLVNKACGALGLSYQELKDIYKDYPACLMEYIEKEVQEQIIEVRFDNQEATISIPFNKENTCNASFLFFDNINDEDLFLKYMNESTDYDFKRSCWTMINCCYMKIKPPTKYETAFCFFKE